MTEYTDRADSLEAAIRDVARDIEADLAKGTRYRGAANPSTSSVKFFKDPGDSAAEYEKQKFPERAPSVMKKYAAQLSGARNVLSVRATPANADERARQLELIALIDAIDSIRTHDDAVALVATFSE